jgi:hypothetical protein
MRGWRYEGMGDGGIERWGMERCRGLWFGL